MPAIFVYTAFGPKIGSFLEPNTQMEKMVPVHILLE